jgi:hypothetical protein
VGLANKQNTISIAVLLTVTAFSCSMPIFSRNQGTNSGTSTTDKNFQPRPAKLSGVLELHEGCSPGYYQVRLQGILEGANVQVESQTDESGHFSLVAPPGRYLMMVNKENCGSKQAIELEENTEHMFSVVVQETKAIEKVTQKDSGTRLPASVIIQPKH